MKILKIIGLSTVGLIFLIVIVSFFLPGTSHVERSIIIQSEASVPFSLVNNLTEWRQWSPWHKLDTGMTIVYSEPSDGEGASYTWKSANDQVGAGKLTIVKSVPDELIETLMEFEGMGTSKGSFKFEQTAEAVKVTWTMDSDGKDIPWAMKIPSKYFCLFADGMVGPYFEKGLNDLKTISETTPPVADKIAGFETEERTIPPMILAGVREAIKTSALNSNMFAKWYGTITQSLQKNTIQPNGPPMAIYYQYGPEKVEVEAAIPVGSAGMDEGKVKFHETTEMKAFVVKYYGDYNKVESVYTEAYAYLKEKGKVSNGAPMEIYITDPGMEKDTSKWLTEIMFPLD
jgi:effector-binding domain-containing protein